MAVLRMNKNRNYTVISNVHLRDKNLSLKAKGLLSMMLSLPDDWDYSINGLVAICKEEISAVRSTLKELQRFGYLVITKEQSKETGRFEYIYDIYEQPITEDTPDTNAPKVESPDVESPDIENPHMDNHTQLNTNKSNTEKSNTDNIIYIVEYLNKKAKTAYRPSGKATQQHIRARLKEGYTVDDFTKVIDKKCKEWIGTQFEQYLRPSTLFGTKFENYLNANIQQTAPQNTWCVNDNDLSLDDLF